MNNNREFIQSSYGLIIIELAMPFMDGAELTKKMNEIFLNYQIDINLQPKIVVVTSHVESEFVRMAF